MIFRIFILFTVLVTTLSCCSFAYGAAETWYCPFCKKTNLGKFCTTCGTAKPTNELLCSQCGFVAKADLNYKFCPECGSKLSASSDTVRPTQTSTVRPTPKPTATPKPRTFEVTSVSLNSDGTTSIRWTDSQDNGPYDICYESYVSSNYYSSEQSQMLLWNALEDVPTKFSTTDWLVAGYPYWITISDASDTTTRYAYIPSSANRFSEFGVDISMDFKARRGTKLEGRKSLSASEIKDNRATTEYGAYIKLTYSQLKRARSYLAHLALKLPDGSVITHLYDTFDLPSGRSYTYWDFFSFDWYFEQIIKQYGSIPVGQYSWAIYFDGQYVNEYSFRIGQ